MSDAPDSQLEMLFQDGSQMAFLDGSIMTFVGEATAYDPFADIEEAPQRVFSRPGSDRRLQIYAGGNKVFLDGTTRQLKVTGRRRGVGEPILVITLEPDSGAPSLSEIRFVDGSTMTFLDGATITFLTAQGNFTVPAITTATNGALAVVYVIATASSGDDPFGFDDVVGWTMHYAGNGYVGNSSVSLGVFSKPMPAAGSTGAFNAVLNQGGNEGWYNWAGGMFALKADPNAVVAVQRMRRASHGL